MNNQSNISLKVVYLLILVFLAYSQSYTQISSSANFIKGGKNDAVKIISAYLLPLERALCFNGANNNMLLFQQKNKTDLQFGIGLNLTTSIINSDDFTYDVNNLNLEEFEAAYPQQTIAQTIAGNQNTILLQTKDKYHIPSTSYPFYKEQPILTLNSPEGNNVTNISFPNLTLFAEKQGNFVEFKILPPIKVENSTIGLFDVGINIQHNLETSLNFLSEMWFDIYISGGYNYNLLTYYLDIKPDEDALTFSAQSDNGPYDNQELQILSQSIPLKLYFVKQINDFSFSLGTGYNASNSNVKMVGNYPVYKTDPTNSFQVVVDDIKDPFQYTETFNKFSLEVGVVYQIMHYTAGIKYSHSYYKNIDLSFSYLF